MGVYLDGITAYTLYKSESVKPYFVDKTKILEDIFPLVEEGNHYVCITRPRRFGKTVMANLLASFFSKGCNAADIFDSLYIAGNQNYKKHRNQYNVIHISLNELPKRCQSYEQYIERVENILLADLQERYPEIQMHSNEAIWDILTRIHVADNSVRFIFILDEWDFIFHRKFITDADKESYVEFLSSLLKDKPYVLFAYMTGILPIAKYSSGSELNMFTEFTMAKSPAFSDYFGFTDTEVDILYQRYTNYCVEPSVTREGLRAWYDGYNAASGECLYNPRSVVQALQYNHLESCKIEILE